MTKFAAIATCLLAACGSGTEPTGIEASYNVVALLPLTGTYAGKGPEHLAAFQKGVRDLEATGGLDQPIRLHIIDGANNATDVNQERLAAQIAELTNENGRHVAAIVSSTTAAMKGSVPYALVEGIPHFEISSGSGLDEVTLEPAADRNFAFALRPLCMPEPGVTADFFKGKATDPEWAPTTDPDGTVKGSVYVIRGDQAHDKMHTREFRSGMTGLGIASMIINPEDLEVGNEGPFDAGIAVAKAAGAKVIYWHLDGDTHNLAFMRAAESAGFTGKLVTCGMARRPALLGASDPGISPYLSGGAPGTATGGTGAEGRLFFAMRGPVSSPSYDAFMAEFKAPSGGDADSFSPAGYDAITLIGVGIAVAGSDHDPAAVQAAIQASSRDGQKFTYGQLKEAIEAAKSGTDIDLDGASGSLDLAFDSVLGNVAQGRFYFETVLPEGADYNYSELADPNTVK